MVLPFHIKNRTGRRRWGARSSLCRFWCNLGYICGRRWYLGLRFRHLREFQFGLDVALRRFGSGLCGGFHCFLCMTTERRYVHPITYVSMGDRLRIIDALEKLRNLPIKVIARGMVTVDWHR